MTTRYTVIELGPEDAEPAVQSDGGVAPIGSDRRFHRPDRSVLLMHGDVLAGRLSCWWSDTAVLNGAPIGSIGHYAARDPEAAARLLDYTCGLLRQHGRSHAVGPMDGNTWRRYRFIVDRGAEPPFALEPDNPDAWPDHWRDADFEVLATYSSAVNAQLERSDPRTDEALIALARAGIRIRSFDMARKEVDLERIYHLSLEAFSDNFLYTPIGREEFMAQYAAVLPFVQPELVLLAERDQDLVGFMFCLPDVMQARRGVPLDTLILKTLAVAQSARGVGLGGALLDLAQRRAAQAGFRRVIHALFHEANVSGRISDRYAHRIRRYALYVRRLTA